MNAEPVYFDSSALVKLLLREPESDALVAALSGWPERFSSVLVRVEVHRVLRRAGASPALRTFAEQMLSAFALVRFDEPVLKLAADLRSRELRPLDAIHVATALSIGDLPAAFVTYDVRMARAARRHGLVVLQPGL